VARTVSGRPHPKTGEVWRLHDLGYSQRRIAAEVGLSQSTVNRILSSPQPYSLDDADGVFAEYDEMHETAKASPSLEAFRLVHRAAIAAHENGYDVPWHSLRLIMLLAAAELEATSRKERASLRSEVTQVFADMKAWNAKAT
jgi:transcriptional regulator with XRE-family HTH domain